MSEPILGTMQVSMSTPDGASPLSSGAMLRQAREQVGMDIALLAAVLKVPVKKLEALEADRLDLLPDLVFVRALAASVCRSLKIEPAAVLDRLPHSNLPHLQTPESGINVPFRSSRAGRLAVLWDPLPKPAAVTLLMLLAGLLAGVLALLFFPFGTHTEPVFSAKSGAAVTAAPAVVTHVQNLTSQPALTLTAADDTLSQVVGSGTSDGIVVFRASAMSWVEVVDAVGVVQLRRNIAPGEVVGVSGTLPLSVVVGRSDTTEVLVHGKHFDLMSFARDNVARFEVKP